MKFIVYSLSKCAPRLGLLKEFENRPEFSLETPLAMMYTQGGNIPHITYEIFQIVCKQPQIIQIPLVSTYQFNEVMESYNGRISEFVGMKDCVSCLTVQDPGNFTQPGHHVKNSIPIWTRNGKVLINPETYMNTVEAFKPDMYYMLSDGDTNNTSSTKRINKAVENTLNFFTQCLERHKKSKILQNSFLMATSSGGYNLDARKRCLNKILQNDELINGFLIDGLHNNGPETEFLPFNEIKPVIEFIIDKLPQEKLRSIQGCFNPVTILKLVQLGIDIFDTSYCHIVTERSAALTFSIDSDEDTEYEMNLRQQRFADDFQPILLGCTCLTCTKYSRGYIHHLLTVQELLAPLLLTIHNVHHYMKFFEKIRKCIREDTIKNLEDRISKQFNAYQRKIPNKNEQVNVVDQIGDIGF